MPELEQLIFLDDAGMYIMLAILVVVVGFGILNTILMAVLERRREFGVVLALGLRPGAIFRIVYLESMMLALVGLGGRSRPGLPARALLPGQSDHADRADGRGSDGALRHRAPDDVEAEALNPIGSVLTILVVALVAALYPAVKASRGRPVDAVPEPLMLTLRMAWRNAWRSPRRTANRRQRRGGRHRGHAALDGGQLRDGGPDGRYRHRDGARPRPGARAGLRRGPRASIRLRDGGRASLDGARRPGRRALLQPARARRGPRLVAAGERRGAGRGDRARPRSPGSP